MRMIQNFMQYKCNGSVLRRPQMLLLGSHHAMPSPHVKSKPKPKPDLINSLSLSPNKANVIKVRKALSCYSSELKLYLSKKTIQYIVLLIPQSYFYNSYSDWGQFNNTTSAISSYLYQLQCYNIDAIHNLTGFKN